MDPVRSEEPGKSMSMNPVENLELRALEQRNQLHQTATELKVGLNSKINSARAKFDINRNAREHFGRAAALAVAIGLASGYGIAGMFTD